VINETDKLVNWQNALNYEENLLRALIEGFDQYVRNHEPPEELAELLASNWKSELEVHRDYAISLRAKANDLADVKQALEAEKYLLDKAIEQLQNEPAGTESVLSQIKNFWCEEFKQEQEVNNKLLDNLL